MKMASRSIHLINKQKKIAHAAQSFFLLAKNQICTCSTLFCLSLPLFCMTKTSNFLVTDYFYGGIIPVFMFAFIFFTAADFHLAGLPLLAASLSHFLRARPI